VTIRLLEVICEIALHVHRQIHRAALVRQAEMIERGSSALPEEADRKDSPGALSGSAEGAPIKSRGDFEQEISWRPSLFRLP